MSQRKRCFFLFDECDTPSVQRYLNRLAAEGWELAEEDGAALTVRLKRTNRRELRYLVLPAKALRTAEELEALVRQKETAGWETVATVNGMDIFRSAPCADPESESVKIPRSFLFSRVVPLILLLAALLLRSVLLLGRGGWYLSHVDSYFVATLPLLLLLTGGLAAWLTARCLQPKNTSPVLMYLHSGITVGLLLWLWGWNAALCLQRLPLPYALGFLLLATAAFIWNHFRRSRGDSGLYFAVALTIAALLLLASLLCPPLLPASNHDSVQLLSVTDLLPQSGTLEYEESRREGSALVSHQIHGESWPDCSLSESFYTCASEALARQVMEDLTQDSSSDTWYSEDGSRMVRRSGRLVLDLWLSGTDLRQASCAEAVENWLSQQQ